MASNSRPSTSKLLFRINDPNFDEIINDIFAEDKQEILSDDEYEDPEDVVDNSDDDSDNIISDNDDENSSAYEDEDYLNDILHRHSIQPFTNEETEQTDELTNIPETYLSRSNFEWQAAEPNQHIIKPKKEKTIKSSPPSLKGPALHLGNKPSHKAVWDMLIDPEMINEIVRWTNKKLKSVREKISKRPLEHTKDKAKILNILSKYCDTNVEELNEFIAVRKPVQHTKDKEKMLKNLLSKYCDTNIEELNAFIAIIMLTSIYKGPNEDITSLFSSKPSGRPIFRAIMSPIRYKILIAALRFDNPETRQQQENDKEAPISYIFHKFVENCKKPYLPSNEMCIGEMLLPFKGSCPFKVYMPRKENAKYGIKIQALADAKTAYFYDGYIYKGKDFDFNELKPSEQKCQISTQVVLRLIKSIKNSGRNVTLNNYYTSVELCDKLTKNGLTLIGTLNKNKKEIPLEFQSPLRRPIGSCLIGFAKNMTLTSYVIKKNKNVLLLSSKYFDKSIDETTGIPEVINFYNKTKNGVDSINDKCYIRKSQRWSLTIFFRICDVATSNAHLLFSCYKENSLMNRFSFIQALANELMKPHLQSRRLHTNLDCNTKDLIDSVLKIPKIQPDQICDVLPSRKTCKFCDPKLKRMTRYKCFACENPMCLQCSKKLCNNCATNKIDKP